MRFSKRLPSGELGGVDDDLFPTSEEKKIRGFAVLAILGIQRRSVEEAQAAQ